MTLLDDICDVSRTACPRIILSEGEDSRIVEAARKATLDGLARIVLVGNEGTVRSLLSGVEGAD